MKGKKIWIADGHCDSLGDLVTGKRDLIHSSGEGHWDFERASKASIGLQFMAVYIEEEYKPYLATLRGLEYLEAALNLLDNHKERFLHIKNRTDLDKLGELGTMGVLLHVEGGEILGESIFILDLIYRLGVRSLGLTWNQRNALADGVGEVGSRGGLSHLGKQVISKMSKLGMIIDVSHLNEAGFWDVDRYVDQPFIASHSCAHALCPHPRNLTDDQLRGLAEKKGMIGINFYPEFLNPSGKATIEDVVKHICYVAEVAGVDFVGLGSDFDGISSTPVGLDEVTCYPNLLRKLQKAGFSSNELEKIAHGNFVRVLQSVLK